MDDIKKVMATAWSIDPSSIPDDASLNDFPPWDSIGHVSLLLALEENYGVEVNSETIQSIRNLDAVMAAIVLHGEGSSGNAKLKV